MRGKGRRKRRAWQKAKLRQGIQLSGDRKAEQRKKKGRRTEGKKSMRKRGEISG